MVRDSVIPKEGRARVAAHALSFGMTPTFYIFFFKNFFFIYLSFFIYLFFFLKSRCHTKRREVATHACPSFAMSMTQDTRDLFV